MEQRSVDLVALNPQPLPPDATIKLVALNPQPLPPDATIELVALNPQPLPPEATINLVALNPQPLPPGVSINLVALNPQPLPPKATIDFVALNPQPLPPNGILYFVAVSAGPLTDGSRWGWSRLPVLAPPRPPQRERLLLRTLPALRPALTGGEPRTVDPGQVRFASARHSVRHRVVCETVEPSDRELTVVLEGTPVAHHPLRTSTLDLALRGLAAWSSGKRRLHRAGYLPAGIHRRVVPAGAWSRPAAKERLGPKDDLVSRRAEIDVLTKRRPEQQLKHLRKVEPFRRLASDAKVPERPVGLEQPKLVSNVRDVETWAPRRRDVVTTQFGDRLMEIRPDAQLRLPSRVPHSHQRAAKVDRLLW
jgi:hypothetical protein